MQLDRFLDALDRLAPDDLERIARALDDETIADEVDWWRATIAIDRAIRHAGRSRQAARAATRASEAIREVAARAERPLPEPTVTRIARGAAEVARGLAAGPATTPIVRLLLDSWRPVVPVG